MENEIYKVTTEGDVEGRSTSTLGYCTGDPQDIKAYYNDRKCYNLYLTPISVVHIGSGSVEQRKADLELKHKLEAELETVKKRLK